MITVMELQLIFFLLSFLHGIYGQVNVPPSTAVAGGDDVSLVCTSTEANPTFTWSYVTAGQSLYTGTTRATSIPRYDNIVLQEGTDAQTSILDISAIELEDEGEYLCSTTAATTPPPNTMVTVEVGSVGTMELIITRDDSNSPFMYLATCETIGSLPEETITWILDGVTQTDGIVETDPDNSTDPLFDKRSVFTFPSTIENYDVPLVCDISGHQVDRLNRQLTKRVDIHKPPQSESGVIMIDFTITGTNLTITCNDTDSEAVPAMSTFNISSNGILIDKPVSDKTVTVTEPEERTEFTCEGSNYLGTATTTQSYGSTTAPPPTTEPITEGTTTYSSGVTATQPSMTTNIDVTVPHEGDPKVGGLSTGAVAGIAVGCILCVVIIVVIVLFLLKPECCPCFAGSGTPAPSNKPSGRAVGSSNGSGSEKDVESPLNGVKDVTAEEKLPQAAPRGHGSIQHTNDNPDQAMYAMVDKKPARGGGGAGDAPDRGSGPGQNEPPGMLYADLDLSHKAGHTDKHVPKNENDVVVYSSILV